MPLIFTPAIVTAIRRDAAAFEDVTLRLLATYVGCYLVYVAFPTAGPKVFGLPFEGAATDGFFFGLVSRAHETGTVYGAAFPSSHVAGAVTVAWLGWRWFRPAAALLLTLQAGGVLMSTVYTQNHYAVDSLAGLGFALAVQTWVVPALGSKS
jgi:membrane-associated phospholipid phosphatase